MRTLTAFLFVFSGCLSGQAHAGQTADHAAAAAVATRPLLTGNPGGQLVQLLLGLLLVIGLIFLLAWLARRLQQQLPSGRSNDTIQLLATRPLGARERLLLVQVGKEQILLGLTPGSIETLHVLQEPVEAVTPESQTVGEFAQRLRQVLRQPDAGPKEPQ